MAEQHWSKPLARRIVLRSGGDLATLKDAGDLFLGEFARTTESELVAHAGALMLRAAETGARADIEAATDQIEIVLRWRRLLL